MDLCPQFVAASPSPPRPRLARPTTCHSGSGGSLQSPDLVNLHYRQPCLPRPLSASCFMSERLSEDPSLAPASAMAGPGWRYTDTISTALATAASPSSASGMLTANYGPLAEYDASLSPVPYHYAGGYPWGCSTARVSSHLVHQAPRPASLRSSRGSTANIPR